LPGPELPSWTHQETDHRSPEDGWLVPPPLKDARSRAEDVATATASGVDHVYGGRIAASSQIQPVLARPLLRGVLHQAAFTVSLVLGTLLIVGSEGASQRAAASIFAASVAACFGISALYHRVNWSPPVRLWMRKLDHAGIYLLIAGTYAPVCLLTLDGAWRPAALSFVSLAAAAATVLTFAWAAAPKWLGAATGIALGWVGVLLLPQLATRLNPAGIALLGLGGVAYTVGAVIYARRRPNPAPRVFGYHELFHALTIVGVACQYVAIAFFVIHAG
jgi:hemolysin III